MFTMSLKSCAHFFFSFVYLDTFLSTRKLVLGASHMAMFGARLTGFDGKTVAGLTTAVIIYSVPKDCSNKNSPVLVLFCLHGFCPPIPGALAIRSCT